MTTRCIRFSVMLACLAIAGCGFLAPAHRVQLYQTTWNVTALDGKSTVGTTMSFNENDVDGVVTVRTPCGSTEMGISLDSDGSQLEFWNLAPRPTSCSVVEQSTNATLFDALEGIESWEVDDNDHIKWIGPNEITATRVPSSDSN